MAQSANDNTAIRASIVLLAATCIALVVANSGLHGIYQTSLKTVIGTDVGPFDLSFSVKDWIKNGLMAIFFLMSASRSNANSQPDPLPRSGAPCFLLLPRRAACSCRQSFICS
jgi:hypothetical protein